jgi:hypothetical protein
MLGSAVPGKLERPAGHSKVRFWRTAGASGMAGMRVLSCRMSVAERAAALGHMGYAFARRPNGFAVFHSGIMYAFSDSALPLSRSCNGKPCLVAHALDSGRWSPVRPQATK